MSNNDTYKKIEHLESDRELASKIKKISFISGIVAAFFSIIMLKIQSLIICIPFILCSITFITLRLIAKRTQISLKNQIIPLILKDINPSLNYSLEANFIKNELLEAGFDELSNIDKIVSEDRVSGIWNNHSFNFCEIHLYDQSNENGKKGRPTTRFKGQFYKISYHRPFNHTTVVRTKRAYLYSLFEPMEKTELEDVEFNKTFSVRTKHELEARYLLTPQLMHKVLELKQRYNMKVLNLSFSNNHIYLMTSLSKNFLEIDLNKSFREQQLVEKIFTEFTVIDEICKSIDLDRN